MAATLAAVLPRPTMTLEAAHQLLSIANKYRMANLRDGIGRCVILNSSQLTNKTSNPPHLQLEVWASVGGHWGAAELLQACAAQAERLGMKVAEIAQLIDLVSGAVDRVRMVAGVAVAVVGVARVLVLVVKVVRVVVLVNGEGGHGGVVPT